MEAQPDNEIISVDAFLIRGSGLVDDILTLDYADFDNDLIPDVIELNIPELHYDDPSDAEGDVDSDGLVNVKEIILGTDITDPDTDGDGLNDYFETMFPPLNPLVNDIDNNSIQDSEEDYDNDGFSNIDEQSAGTDPFNESFLGIGEYIYDIIEYFKNGNIDNWTVYDNDPENTEILSTTDDETGNQVVKFIGDGTKNGYRYLFPSTFTVNRFRNPVLYWTMKYSEPYNIYISCRTKDGHRYLNYTASDTDSLASSDTAGNIHHGLGKNTIDGKWHNVRRSLNADLMEGQNTNTLISVDALLIRGSGYIGEIGMYSYRDDDSDMIPDMIEDSLGIDLLPNEDLDNDGLSNRKEITIGTDISNPDSDGDGLFDGYEQNITQTDPVNTDNSSGDPDGDGITNIEEMNSGTNPSEYTYEGAGGYLYEKTIHNSAANLSLWDIYDKTPEGAEIKKLEVTEHINSVQLIGDGTKNGYKFTISKPLKLNYASKVSPIINWTMKYSESYIVYIGCQTEQGHRYIYYTASTKNNLESLGNIGYVHHGLSLETKDGKWHTIRRNLLKDLQDAQPNNRIISVDAFLIRGSGEVSDITTYTYLDSDGDLIPDALEEKAEKDLLPDGDADNDGIVNLDEIIQNTDPNKKYSYLDSDGDQVPDFYEILENTDPNDSNSFPESFFYSFITKLTPDDVTVGDSFGQIISTDGKILAVSSWQGVYVFENIDGLWTQTAKLTPTEEKVYTVLAVDSNNIFIGIPSAEINEISSHGVVYVYSKINGIWEQKKLLIPDDGTDSSNFGSSVSVSGNIAIIGAEGTESVYVFENIEDIWAQTDRLTDDDESSLSSFGRSVSIDGNIAVISAQEEKSVYLYSKINGVWTKTSKLKSDSKTGYDYFGSSVSIDNNFVVVGATYANDYRGGAYLFKRTNGIWVQIGKLFADESEKYGNLGWVVSINNNNIALGTFVGDDALYMFTNLNETWSKKARLHLSEENMYDGFGQVVSIGGNTLFAGTPYHKSEGAVYVYQINDLTPPEVIECKPSSMIYKPFNNVILTFSELINGISLKENISFIAPDGQNIDISNIKNISRKKWELSFEEQIIEGEYSLTIGSGIKDISNIRMENEFNIRLLFMIDSDNDKTPDSIELEQGTDPNDPNSFLDNDGDELSDFEEEYIYHTDPDSPDTDNDGFLDGWEVKYGLDPLVPDDKSSDLDEDGLILQQEFQLGTNPLNPDTDSDGMSDGWEIIYGFDPLIIDDTTTDTDSDGLTLVAEFLSGTNPNNPDTDGDGLPDGWEVLYGLNPMTPDNTSIDSDNDGLSLLEEFQAGTNPRNSDTDRDGLPDGWEVTYGLNPVIADITTSDNDDDGLSLISEYRHGTNPNNPDTDGDGLDDKREISYLQTDPTNPDTDGDGLIDGWEVKYRFNPKIVNETQSDTDNDGLILLQESQNGTDPNNSDTDGDGLNDGWEVNYDLDPLIYDEPDTDTDNDGLTLIQEFQAVTNPNNSDSDGDELSDGDEIITHGTNPVMFDTDSDGLPDGWEVNYDLDPNISNDTTTDIDNDGLSLLQEYQNKTNPNSSDTDNDGLNDIDEISNHKTNPVNSDTDNDGLNDGDEVNIHETDPNKIDSDGDLLNDGWEVNYQLNPNLVNDISADSDGDGLNTYYENIYGTDPNNADTDGDSVSDGDEASQGSSPNDPSDNGSPPSPEQMVSLTLTVGDHSGSASERYVMNVGPISHQAPEFGKVVSTNYNQFRAGQSYKVKLIHTGSNKSSPDYDYTAKIKSTYLPSGVSMIIDDPNGILGVHDESSYFYAAGKSATIHLLNIKFQNTEEKVNWEQGGSIDVTTFLTSDSTKDNIIWSISGTPDVTINQNGILLFSDFYKYESESDGTYNVYAALKDSPTIRVKLILKIVAYLKADIILKRKHINLKSDSDKYGHWWAMVGSNESYGWWPDRHVSPWDTLTSVPGELNGQTIGNGTLTKDHHHYDTNVEEEYQMYVISHGRTIHTVHQDVRRFANGYSGTWSWPFGQNCHSFQESMVETVKLIKEEDI